MNLLGVEPLIVRRLRDKVVDARFVGSASAFTLIDDIAPQLPAIFVGPLDADYSGRENQARVQIDRQSWLVSTVVGHVANESEDESTALIAGALMGEIVAALLAWKPAAGVRALTLVERWVPRYFVGYAQYYLVFETSVTVAGGEK